MRRQLIANTGRRTGARSLRRALAAACACGLLAAGPAAAAVRVVVVEGLGGDAEYARRFAEWTQQVAQRSATAAGTPDAVRRLAGDEARAPAVERSLRELASQLKAGDQAILLFVGHGSWDGSEYRLNLPGPDLTGRQLGALLDALPAGAQQLVINATSASGAVAESWQRPYRTVITATRTAGERNATRFAGYWAEALGSDEADRDKDGSITAREAFDFANRKVADSFKSDAALVTEHAKLAGPDPARFVVARLGAGAQFAADPQLIALHAEQAGIETRLDAVRARKAALDADRYYSELEPVLVELARLGQRIEARLAALGATGGSDAAKR